MSLILSDTNKSHDTEVTRELSINRECVDLTCEIYSQILQVAEELEALNPLQIVQIFEGMGAKELLRPRTLWKFFANPNKSLAVTDLRQEKDWEEVSRRTVERHIEQLRELHIISQLPTKGQWGKPGSRPSVRVGRFPSTYKLNPLFAGNLLTSDAIDMDTRRLLVLCQKLLLGMPGFQDCLFRVITCIFRIVGQIRNLGDFVQKIPELNVFPKGQSWGETSLQSRETASFVLDELVGTAIFKMNFCIDGEDLPWEEFRRQILI